VSEMAPERWGPRDPTFKDPRPLGCGHGFHGLPCVGLVHYRGPGTGCDCQGPYANTEEAS
jgi:hypothetical protein